MRKLFSLTEMPHIYLDGQPFDVEIEAHLKSKEELFNYFSKVLSGESFLYKYGLSDGLNIKQRKELLAILTSGELEIRIPLVRKYGQVTYDKFVDFLRTFSFEEEIQ